MRQPNKQNAKRFVCPSQTYTAKAPYPSVSQGDSLQRLREKCGLFPCGGCCGAQILCATIFIRSAEKNRQPVCVKRFLLPCKPTDPFPFLFSNVRGQVPASSRATATQCVYQGLFTAKSCAVCLSASLPEKSGSVPCEETILFVNVAAIAAKMSCFPCVVSAAKKIGNGSVYSNEFCVPGKPINPNLLRKPYGAKAARIPELREKSAVFPCVVSVAACFL